MIINLVSIATTGEPCTHYSYILDKERNFRSIRSLDISKKRFSAIVNEEFHQVPNFIESARESILGNWENFELIINSELFDASNIDSSKNYKSIRSALRKKVEVESEKQHNILKKFIETDFSLINLNRNLYFVLFDFYIESMIFSKNSKMRGKFGDTVPTENLISRMGDVLQKEKSVRGKHGSYLYWKAVMHYLNHDHAESFRLFPLPASLPPEKYILDRYMLGSKTVITNIDYILRNKPLVDFPEEINFAKRESLGSEELVILTCADEVYFERLGDIYLRSFASLTKNVRLHIHIMRKNDKPLNLENLKNWQDKKIDVSYSDATPYDEKSWFTVVRWLLLPNLLKTYEIPILSTDFDVALDPRGFSDYVENAINYDIGLNINKFPSNYMPWNTINANQVFINNTELGALFSSSLREVSLRWYDIRRGDQWWIDQNILYACYRDLMRSCHSMKVMNNFKYPSIKRIVKEKNNYLKGVNVN